VPAPTPEEFLARAAAAIHLSQPSPLALVVNYPSNPTAQMVDIDFYKEVVALAKRHGMWVLSDCAYADTYFDDTKRPPSILQVEGAKDIALNSNRCRRPMRCPAGAWALPRAIAR
jgi:alanine-synthesizing transaminase